MRKWTGVFAAAMFMFAAGAQASQKIISFDAPHRGGAIVKGVEGMGGRVIRQFRVINALVAVFPDDTKDSRISSLDGVTAVENDVYRKWIESDPVSMNAAPLPGVENVLSMMRSGEGWEAPVLPSAKPAPDAEIPWGVKRVNAAGAWNFTEGAGVKVAVIDTGVDYTHPELAANYVGGYNAIDSTLPPMDDHGHGTHVAGTIAAVRNGTGVAGVAPKAVIYGVKVIDKSGSGTDSSVIAGIEWATLNGMQVINMSLGGGGYMEAMHNAVKAAKDAGIAVVCAAGNDAGPVNYPAKYPESIAVSASNNMDMLAYFSSRGPEIAVIAPGVNVYSTAKGGGYATMSGTSMACPHVAGLAALAVGAGASNPDAVRQSLVKAATPLPRLKPTEQGAGMVDAAKLH